MKKKLGRPPKKKPIETFREEVPAEAVIEEELPKPVVGPVIPMCECGEPAHPGSHQCWKCSHRP